MTDSLPRVPAARQRSRSLSELDVQRWPTSHSKAFQPAQEFTLPVDDPVDSSRCACGRLFPVFAPELQQKLERKGKLANMGFFEREEARVNAGAEEQDKARVNVNMQEQYEAQADVGVQEQSPSPDEEDIENAGRHAEITQYRINEARHDTKDSDAHSFRPCAEEMEDEITSQEHWTTTSLPLPTPNNLTSTYLPLHSHKALTNHLSSSKISHHLANATPFFLHSTLQLPSTLSHLLDIRLPTILRRLTPAVLLEHTTNLNPETLLPSVVEVKMMSAYHHVQGLVFFPSFSKSTSVPTSIADRINDYYQAQAKCEMRKVNVGIEDAGGKREEIATWAWVSEESGVEGRWTLEDFVAGKVMALEGMEW